MFRHVAVFRWAEGTTTEAVETLQEALKQLPSSVPELLDYRAGADAGLTEGNWDFAVVADFHDVGGWRAYTAYPAHQKLLTELIRPILEERAAVQYQC